MSILTLEMVAQRPHASYYQKTREPLLRPVVEGLVREVASYNRECLAAGTTQSAQTTYHGQVEEALLRAHDAGVNAMAQRYQGGLVSYLTKMVWDVETAEDLFQNTCVRVHLNFSQGYDLQRPFSSWLYRIAINLAKNELRRRQRSVLEYEFQLPNHEGGVMEWPDTARRVDERSFGLEEKVLAAIDQIPAQYQEAFVLRELENKSYVEIASLLNITLGTVKSRLHRGRNEFANYLRAHARLELEDLGLEPEGRFTTLMRHAA
jgi:RNA polymerase sigma-70 factor, ECF subfamily